ncbi:hypothetical protein MMC22_005848 [Lobaria immixta]|nr:hypothetical protein [Lobaria immixta]
MGLEALDSAVKQEEGDKRRQEEAHQQGMRLPRLRQARNELEWFKNEKAAVQVKRNRGSDPVPQPSSTTPHPASLPTPTLSTSNSRNGWIGRIESSPSRVNVPWQEVKRTCLRGRH